MVEIVKNSCSILKKEKLKAFLFQLVEQSLDKIALQMHIQFSESISLGILIEMITFSPTESINSNLELSN